MSLLEIKNLSLSFGSSEVVRDVSFTMEPGEMLAIVGESGSGKTLTALSCMRLLPPSARMSGSVWFKGEDVAGMPEPQLRALRGDRIGMIFQEPMTALNPLHTVGKQIAEVLQVHSGVGRNLISPPRLEQLEGEDPGLRRDKLISDLLDEVGLSRLHDRLDAYPHQLSGGERQRVMIAMAIANNPDLLIADEPTTAVDVTIQAKILKLLKTLQREREMAILFITHDLTLVQKMADRVGVMKQGELVEIGKVAEVFAAPRHDYTKHLLGSQPKGRAVPVVSQPAPVMACEDLCVRFPIKKGVFARTAGYVEAVKNINVSIPEGTTLGVVGESGSGKTTLAFALLKLTPSTGRIVFLTNRLDQIPAKAIRPWRKRMQLVFQDPFSSLNPRMNVSQIIEEGLLVHEPKLTEAERTQRIDAILKEVGLSSEMKQRYPHEFSGGQRQRISIARAMILKPSLVVLDEPTSALDLSVQSQILALLKDLQLKHRLSYIFISHDLRVVRAIAHHILVLRGGAVVEQGDTESLFANPKEEYTKALMQAAWFEEAA